MKRSDVVYLIANYFYENNVEPEKADELGDTVLKELEDLGMLPPLVQLSHINAKDNAWDPEDQQASQDDTNMS